MDALAILRAHAHGAERRGDDGTEQLTALLFFHLLIIIQVWHIYNPPALGTAPRELCTDFGRAGGRFPGTKKKRTSRCASNIASRSRSFGSAGAGLWPQTAMTQQLL